MSSTTVVRKKGQVTLPVKLRRDVGIEDNDLITMIPWKKKAIIVIPKKLKVFDLLAKTSLLAKKKGVTLEEMLLDLEEIRHNS